MLCYTVKHGFVLKGFNMAVKNMELKAATTIKSFIESNTSTSGLGVWTMDELVRETGVSYDLIQGALAYCKSFGVVEEFAKDGVLVYQSLV